MRAFAARLSGAKGIVTLKYTLSSDLAYKTLQKMRPLSFGFGRIIVGCKLLKNNSLPPAGKRQTGVCKVDSLTN
jgi:hypothetical protein